MDRYNDLGVIILAAGKGTRMKSDLAKVLHKVAGKSMVVHVTGTALKVARDNNIHVVVGHQAREVTKEVTKYFGVEFAEQKNLLGTGDAVKAALPGLKPSIKNVLVLSGDVPLIHKSTLAALVTGHKKNRADISVLAMDLENPTGYGRMVMDGQNNMLCIKEESDATDIEKKIKKVNAGIYCFDKALLSTLIDELKPDNKQAEYYLTDVIGIARRQNRKIAVITTDDPRQVIGVNTLEELDKAEFLLGELGK